MPMSLSESPSAQKWDLNPLEGSTPQCPSYGGLCCGTNPYVAFEGTVSFAPPIALGCGRVSTLVWNKAAYMETPQNQFLKSWDRGSPLVSQSKVSTNSTSHQLHLQLFGAPWFSELRRGGRSWKPFGGSHGSHDCSQGSNLYSTPL